MKFASLMKLSINLGVHYLRELHVGRNACYTSEQKIGELLQCLSQVIEASILSSMRGIAFYALMTDKSTDIAVLKQLVLLGRYVTASEEVKTSYLCIVDIPDGKAVSILDTTRTKKHFKNEQRNRDDAAKKELIQVE